jgi:RNA recognition motif-containing protein
MRILPGKDLRGRPLKVKPCVQKRAVDSRPHSILLQFTRWSDRSRLNSQWRRQDPTVAASSANLLIPMQQGRRLFIGGLPKPTDNHTSDLVIRELFKDFTVEAVSKVKSPTKESLRGNGWYAFVDLNTVEEAQRAIRQLHGISMWGGNLTVNLAKRNPGKVLEAIAREREQETEMGRGKGREHAPWRSNATETSVFKAVPS